jgi:fructose-bisphosphate aldolase class II
MSNKTLGEWLQEAQASDWALPHFNISTADQLKVMVEVCVKLKSPLMIGLSEGEVDFFGYNQARAIIDAWKKETGLPIFLNADHHHSLERAKQAIDAGFDSVNIDLSLKPDNDNIAETRAVVEYARAQNRPISIEGEIGALATQSSEINKVDIVVPESSLTTPQKAKEFVDLTGVDRLTPAVGNFHGMVAPGNTPKRLNRDRITEIHQAVSIPLTLHGGSGLPDEDLQFAAANMSNIHINTELRVSYTEAIRTKITETTTPYKYLKVGGEAMAQTVEKNLRLFGSLNKAEI